jgi:hydrogenase nickel incorporation protein HypA/HybF
MHELSIVLSIVDIAEKEVEKHKANSVEVIVLDIGELSGIEPPALDFAWECAIENTVLANAERITNYIKGKAVCMDCGEEFSLDEVYASCPACNSYLKDYIAGRELKVKSLTLI